MEYWLALRTFSARLVSCARRMSCRHEPGRRSELGIGQHRWQLVREQRMRLLEERLVLEKTLMKLIKTYQLEQHKRLERGLQLEHKTWRRLLGRHRRLLGQHRRLERRRGEQLGQRRRGGPLGRRPWRGQLGRTSRRRR